MSRIKKVMQEQRFFQKLKAKKTHDPTINNALSITNGVSESTEYQKVHKLLFTPFSSIICTNSQILYNPFTQYQMHIT
jgi:hypothetical protein